MRPDGLRRIARVPSRPQGQGPDIGLVVLPPEKVIELKKIRDFYNLDEGLTQISRWQPQVNEGWWFACGLPGEFDCWYPIDEDGSLERLSQGKSFIDTYKEERVTFEGYDYFRVPIDYKKVKGLPSTFGGIRGGGVWYSPALSISEDSDVFDLEGMKEHTILAGICFSEIKLSGVVVSILCHGWESVYKIVYQYLKRLSTEKDN